MAARPPNLVEVGSENEAAEAEDVFRDGLTAKHALSLEPASDHGFVAGLNDA